MNKKLLLSLIIIIVLVSGGVWVYKTGNQLDLGPRESSDAPQTAESDQEFFKNTPGLINSISKTDGGWTLAVDILTLNEGPFLDNPDKIVNQNSKIRNLKVTAETKAYACKGGVPGLEITTAEFIKQMEATLKRSKLGDWTNMATFDITGDTIDALYPRPAGCIS